MSFEIDQLVFLHKDTEIVFVDTCINVPEGISTIDVAITEDQKFYHHVPDLDENGVQKLDLEGEPVVKCLEYPNRFKFKTKIRISLTNDVILLDTLDVEELDKLDLKFKVFKINASYSNLYELRRRYNTDIKPAKATGQKNLRNKDHLNDLRFGKGKRW